MTKLQLQNLLLTVADQGIGDNGYPAISCVRFELNKHYFTLEWNYYYQSYTVSECDENINQVASYSNMNSEMLIATINMIFDKGEKK